MRSALALALLLLATSLARSEPAAPPAELATQVRDGNTFAVALYRDIAARPGNVFFSPYSISSALAMTYAGARGQTAEQMAQALHFTLPVAKINQAFAALNQELLAPGQKRPFQLHIANGLFAAQDFAFRPEYQQAVQASYGAALQRLDFANNTEAARQEINRWVEAQTKDKIKDLVPAGILDAATRLVLANAIYFKSPWSHPFAKGATRPQDFTLADATKVQVPLMHQTEHFAYLEGDGFQLVELPYQGGALTLAIVLPRRADGLSALARTLTAARLHEWQGRVKPRPVEVFLPRFKITTAFQLNEALARLGMGIAFTDRADFSGISRGERLAISAVLHKAFVDVNEEGTEAAAASAVGIKLTAAPNFTELVRFRADHPFLLVLRENRTGSILFMGHVADPR